MDTISAPRLATMLNEGFTGKVTFSGRAHARESGTEFGVNGPDFYTGQGKFTLYPLFPGAYRLSLGDGSKESNSSSFSFHLRDKADHASPPKYGDIVGVPIKMGNDGYLQIEPRKIEY